MANETAVSKAARNLRKTMDPRKAKHFANTCIKSVQSYEGSFGKRTAKMRRQIFKAARAAQLHNA